MESVDRYLSALLYYPAVNDVKGRKKDGIDFKASVAMHRDISLKLCQVVGTSQTTLNKHIQTLYIEGTNRKKIIS